MAQKQQISVALPPKQLKRLKEIARKEDVSIGHLLRRGADIVIKRQPEKTAA